MTDCHGRTALWWAIRGLEGLYSTGRSMHAMNFQVTAVQRIWEKTHNVFDEKAIQLAKDGLNEHRMLLAHQESEAESRHSEMIYFYRKVLDIMNVSRDLPQPQPSSEAIAHRNTPSPIPAFPPSPKILGNSSPRERPKSPTVNTTDTFWLGEENPQERDEGAI